jgi:hypothetical protein
MMILEAWVFGCAVCSAGWRALASLAPKKLSECGADVAQFAQRKRLNPTFCAELTLGPLPAGD